MDYLQFFTIIGTIVGFLIWSHKSLGKTIDVIHTDTNRMIDSIQQDMRMQSSRIDQQMIRMDQLYSSFQESIREQSERTDKLYEMFIDLVRSKK